MPEASKSGEAAASVRLRRRLLAWYDRAGRDLPWRERGRQPDPYRVWLSEIMLQQTTVATVRPYYAAFLARWPDVAALAAAPLDEVLHAWQGLGYYARARNLHRCARVVAAEHGGAFPDTEDGLRALPGVGAYTAAAVAAIAFGRPCVPVDGNVERVMARLHAVERPLPDAKPTLRELASRFAGHRRAGDLAQALMDLGATVCLPRRPACAACPWTGDCAGHAAGDPASLPRRRQRKERPTRYGTVFWLERDDGRVLLRRRPESGLLGGMIEVPSTEWCDRPWADRETLAQAPAEADWRPVPGLVQHGFTHFALELKVLRAQCRSGPDGLWRAPDDFASLALPTMTRKVVRHVLEDGAGPLFASHHPSRGDRS